MINQASIDAVAASRFSAQFLRPAYEGYCFSNIPGFLLSLFDANQDRLPELPREVLPGKRRYNKVAVFFVDAFGWRFFQEYSSSSPFLRRFESEGAVSKLTSQFPSTTSCHVTALHTGKPVYETGIYEWHYYEPVADAMVSPLLFSFSRDAKRRETLLGAGIEPEALFPFETNYQRLARCGVKSSIFQDRDYAETSYSRTVLKGADIVPYRGMAQGLKLVSERMAAEKGPSLYILYYDVFDGKLHHHGPGSAEAHDEAAHLLRELDGFLENTWAREPDCLIAVMADHGQVEIDPKTTIYLNLDFPNLADDIKRTSKGELMAPAGSPRDLFLHVKEERLNETAVVLAEFLRGKAEVYHVNYLLEKGIFGGSPSQSLKARLGNLAILPYANESVWWYEEGIFGNVFRGHHGGLTPQEMEVPFLLLGN